MLNTVEIFNLLTKNIYIYIYNKYNNNYIQYKNSLKWKNFRGKPLKFNLGVHN